MGSLFEILYDVLFQPQTAMQNIAERKNIGQALVAVLLSTIIPIWAFYLAFKTTEMLTMINILVVIKVVGSIVMWGIGAAIWNLIAELIGGKGTAAGLLTALGFAQLPRIFIVPLWMFISLMPESSKTVLLSVALLSILCWSVYLDIVAIKEVHQLSAAKSILVLTMPIVVVGLLCIMAVIMIGSSAVMNLSL